MLANMLSFIQQFGAACSPGSSFLGFPTWYKYLDSERVAGRCTPKIDFSQPITLANIILAIIEILLRIAALVAIAFVISGGIQYLTSQGQPDKTSKARGTVIAALIGLVIAVSATAIVTFIAGSL